MIEDWLEKSFSKKTRNLNMCKFDLNPFKYLTVKKKQCFVSQGILKCWYFCSTCIKQQERSILLKIPKVKDEFTTVTTEAFELNFFWSRVKCPSEKIQSVLLLSSQGSRQKFKSFLACEASQVVASIAGRMTFELDHQC